MALPANVLQTRFFFKGGDSKQWSFTLYWAPASPLTDAFDLATEADSFFDYFGPHLANVISDQAQAIGCYLRYTNATVDLEAFSTGVALDGTISGEELPIQDCIAIRRLTGKPGRSKRGRIFLSSISEESVQFNHLIGGHIATFQVLAADISADKTFLTTWHARHWDRKNNVMEPITQAKVLLRTVSRRDRERYVPYQAV